MRSKRNGWAWMVVLVLGTAGCPSSKTHTPEQDGGLGGAGGESGEGGEGGEGGAGDGGGDGGTANPAGQGGQSGQGAGTGGDGGGGGGTADPDGGVSFSGHTSGEKIDLLFMVDNSNSMREEQAALRAQFPRLIERLIDGVDLDGDGTLEYEGAHDVHLGVVSSDLGLPGLGMTVESCNGLGDDGQLNHVASTDVTGCSAQVYNPPFLAYVDGLSDAAQTATDFACIATVGNEGCGFEQQLESSLKAVWPGDDARVSFVTDEQGFGRFGQAGPGFPNGDFIRNDPSDLSMVVIVLVTDEEDCSSRRMDHFVPGASDEGMNVRCYLETLKPTDQSNLFDVNRYVELFKMLRPNNEQLVVFGAIVGVPPALVTPDKLAAVRYDDPASVAAFYDGILSDPSMQYTVDDRGTDEKADDNLKTSCTAGPAESPTTLAYPPRRIVQVAKGFGRNGFVQSICEDDFVPAIDLIITRIAQAFEPVLE